MKPLGWWLMLVGTLRLASVWFGFFDIWALRLAVFSKTQIDGGGLGRSGLVPGSGASAGGGRAGPSGCATSASAGLVLRRKTIESNNGSQPSKPLRMATSLSSHTEDTTCPLAQEDVVIPSSLKFLISNIKTIVPIQLSNENYSTWRSQILKLFRANNYAAFLDKSTPVPPRLILNTTGISRPNMAYSRWMLVDHNLIAAICSTSTTGILPYIFHLDNYADIRNTLERRLQATNHSCVIQLKNELHHISMGQQTMHQYLTNIKALIDNIAAAGKIDGRYLFFSYFPFYDGFFFCSLARMRFEGSLKESLFKKKVMKDVFESKWGTHVEGNQSGGNQTWLKNENHRVVEQGNKENTYINNMDATSMERSSTAADFKTEVT
ncbi:hypothetical protein M5K25_013164 [Dendrobium thyrsiflorum]|uniref:Retrotransposon Copia-like N-terminal domain-containing protein n=1 Tax=Dendrobium thyrsiflorum TaxID=117978 RepID=A0ABD0UZF2_DENTH